MGIIRTDQWIEEGFDRPVEICEKLEPYFHGQKASEIYQELLKFGMYRPSGISNYLFHQMLDYQAWAEVGKLVAKYKRKWSGPDVPVFLFPIDQRGGFLFRQEQRRKAGVSFPDKMFLFLAEYDNDMMEIESLFVHEYHHVCRLRALNKKMADYTLLDSIIIEGLAEYAVLKFCGENYLADWCQMYSDREITAFWKKFLKPKLDRKKTEREHDQLLYGGGRVPQLLGYSAGFHVVKKYYEQNRYSTKLSFITPAAKYLEVML